MTTIQTSNGALMTVPNLYAVDFLLALGHNDEAVVNGRLWTAEEREDFNTEEVVMDFRISPHGDLLGRDCERGAYWIRSNEVYRELR